MVPPFLRRAAVLPHGAASFCRSHLQLSPGCDDEGMPLLEVVPLGQNRVRINGNVIIRHAEVPGPLPPHGLPPLCFPVASPSGDLRRRRWAALRLSVAQVKCVDGDVVAIYCEPLAIVYRVCIAAAAGTLTAAAPAPVVPPAPPCAAPLPPDFSGIPLSFTFRSYRANGPAA